MPALSLLATGALAFAPVLARGDDNARDFVDDWSATGVGCKGAKDAKGGDVVLDARPPGGATPETWALRFRVDGLRLRSPLPSGQPPASLTFASECSLRMALFPGPRARVRNVTASTRLRISKPSEVRAWTLADLQLGNATIARLRTEYAAKETFGGRLEDVRLVPGRTAEESMPATECGQPKVLGLDLILTAERKTHLDRIEAGLDGGRIVEILVDLTPCAS